MSTVSIDEIRYLISQCSGLSRSCTSKNETMSWSIYCCSILLIVEFSFEVRIYICVHYFFFERSKMMSQIMRCLSLGSLSAIMMVSEVSASGVMLCVKCIHAFWRNQMKEKAHVRLLPSVNGWFFYNKIQKVSCFFF